MGDATLGDATLGASLSFQRTFGVMRYQNVLMRAETGMFERCGIVIGRVGVARSGLRMRGVLTLR